MNYWKEGKNKMTIQDVMELKSMGFSTEEIIAFRDSEKFAESTPEASQEAIPEAAPEAPKEAPESPKYELPKEVVDTLSEMNKVLKDMQSANIMYSHYPETTGRSPEDIIGEIISPTYNRKGE